MKTALAIVKSKKERGVYYQAATQLVEKDNPFAVLLEVSKVKEENGNLTPSPFFSTLAFGFYAKEYGEDLWGIMDSHDVYWSEVGFQLFTEHAVSAKSNRNRRFFLDDDLDETDEDYAEYLATFRKKPRYDPGDVVVMDMDRTWQPQIDAKVMILDEKFDHVAFLQAISESIDHLVTKGRRKMDLLTYYGNEKVHNADRIIRASMERCAAVQIHKFKKTIVDTTPGGWLAVWKNIKLQAKTMETDEYVWTYKHENPDSHS